MVEKPDELADEPVIENELADEPVIENEPAAELSVEEKALDDPRILEMAEKIQAARAEGKTKLAAELVAQNRALYARVLTELSGGRETEPSPEEKELVRREELKIIRENLPAEPTNENLMEAYHLRDSEGRLSIDSPLFHDSTKKAFDRYLKLVSRFEALSGVEQYTGIAIKDMPRADSERTEAHDLTAKMVASDLGLPFDEARGLVAKIRDERFSGPSETSYKAATHRAVKDVERTGGHVSEISRPVVEYLRRLAAENTTENE